MSDGDDDDDDDLNVATGSQASTTGIAPSLRRAEHDSDWVRE